MSDLSPATNKAAVPDFFFPLISDELAGHSAWRQRQTASVCCFIVCLFN